MADRRVCPVCVREVAIRISGQFREHRPHRHASEMCVGGGYTPAVLADLMKRGRLSDIRRPEEERDR